MSYINLPVDSSSIIPKPWMLDSHKEYYALSKAMFVLEHSIFVHFIKHLYGDVPPVLLRDYVKEIKEYAAELNKVNDETPGGSDVYKQCVAFINDFLGYAAPKAYDDVIELLNLASRVDRYPHVVATAQGLSFYRPYLMYYGTEGRVVDVSGVTALPTFAVRGNTLFLFYESKFVGYHFTEELKKQLESAPYPISLDNFFSFLSGFNWRDSSFTALFGILSTYCFDLDVSNAPNNSNELVYKLLRSVVTGYKPAVSPYVDSLSLSFDNTVTRRLFISFLICLRKHYGLKLDDAHVIATIIGKNDNEGTDNLYSYLEMTKPQDVSTEMIKAFKSSIFGSFEELDIKNRALKKKEDDVSALERNNPGATNISSVKETLEAFRKYCGKITGPAPLRNAGNAGESDASSAGALPDPGSIPGAGTGAGDAGATGEDDTAGTGSDQDKDPSAMGNDENTPPNDPQNNQPGAGAPDTHVPDLPDVSDKKGVKLELSSSESTDTVFYRLELKTYINSILANPPKSLSVEKIEILKKIKSFWINTLAPQCVHDILNTVISLPKMFRIHNSKKNKDK